METTFITIHDLSLDARILYCSTSVEDILGYQPHEVTGKSCWEYFHPDEIPFARAIHGRGVQLDKAAVLNYCQIKSKSGLWIGCECVFTIVHDVMVGCTSIYRRGMKSQKRAQEAPVIRRIFSSSPRDPRYHMLSYISQKFSRPSRGINHEPRAALFLNRFSRTLTIVYATNGLAEILGLTATEMIGKSFYYCIQENCLREAVKCLESAKANDSIAYLRFWFRDPRQDDRMGQDERMSDAHSSADEDETGGVHLDQLMDTDHTDQSETAVVSDSSVSMRSSVEPSRGDSSLDPNSRTSSGNSTDMGGDRDEQIFDRPMGNQSSTSSISSPDESQTSVSPPWSRSSPQIELEAVVSCTSDGLVLILRRARPLIPDVTQPSSTVIQHPYRNGLFASPWASEPILPDLSHSESKILNTGHSGAAPLRPVATYSNQATMTGPAQQDFMDSIREVVVFAWSLAGINGSLEQYARGTPMGESQPSEGLRIWDPSSNIRPETFRPNIADYLTNEQNAQNNAPAHNQAQHQEMEDHDYEDHLALSNWDIYGVPKQLLNGNHTTNGYAATNGNSNDIRAAQVNNTFLTNGTKGQAYQSTLQQQPTTHDPPHYVEKRPENPMQFQPQPSLNGYSYSHGNGRFG